MNRKKINVIKEEDIPNKIEKSQKSENMEVKNEPIET